MVTLTFPGVGVHNYDLALKLLQDFIHDHGDAPHWGKEWLAVPELHPGGHGLHWHVLAAAVHEAGIGEPGVGWTEFLRRRGMPRPHTWRPSRRH